MAYITISMALSKESEWDNMVSLFPRCAICEEIIFPDSVVYVAHERCVCAHCKEILDDSEEVY